MSFLLPSKRTHDNNELTPVIDGENVYRELLAALRAAKRFIYLATWSFDPGLELTRTGSGDPTVREILVERAKAGLEVKVLMWDIYNVGQTPLGNLGAFFQPDVTDFKRELTEAGAKAGSGSTLLLTTNPSKPPSRRFASGADHQKFWVFDDGGKKPFGFVGGLNLGQHEWDTREHLPGDRRRTSPGINRQGLELQDALKSPLKAPFVRGVVEKNLDDRFQLTQRIDSLNLSAQDKKLLKDRIVDFTIDQLKSQKPLPSRHDVMCRLRGPVAAELLEEFRIRWKLASGSTLNEKKGSIPSPSGAKTKVQIGHTAYYPSPGGKLDVWKSYLHALKQAEKYIYIETQYFMSLSVVNVIVERLQRRPYLEVVILLPMKPEEFAVGPAITVRESQLVNNLESIAARKTPHQQRVHAFGLSKWNPSAGEYESIYIHAKLAIIDDEWMTIGSANCGPRSFEFDTELNAFTNDIQEVVNFRRELWSEHMGIAKDDNLLKNPQSAIKRMAQMAEANGKKTSGELNGRLVPLIFNLPPLPLRPYYEEIAKEFF
jgi:phosphatidylserine/phosphatidylglycerophosphate/cardiolipin synthase-like enzyme